MAIEKLVRTNIRQLTPYASARSEYQGRADIWLDANENPFETGLNRYPDPLQWAVKEKIAGLKGIAPGNIFLGNGSDEVIDLLIRIFCEPREDHILILPPTYGMYAVSARIADVGVQEGPMKPDFQPDPEAVLRAVDGHSKLLFLCSPNNPTGNNLDAGILQELAGAFPGITVIDEAYIDFSDQKSALSWREQFPRLVVMQTFSKAWGMAGLRLGMAFAAPGIIELLNKVKPPYNINALTQRAALEALQRPEDKEAWVATILAERRRLAAALEQLPWVQRVFSSDANFLLVRVDDPQGVYRFLLDGGIVVRDRSRVLHCAGCLRFTVGAPDENDRLLERLRAFSSLT